MQIYCLTFCSANSMLSPAGTFLIKMKIVQNSEKLHPLCVYVLTCHPPTWTSRGSQGRWVSKCQSRARKRDRRSHNCMALWTNSYFNLNQQSSSLQRWREITHSQFVQANSEPVSTTSVHAPVTWKQHWHVTSIIRFTSSLPLQLYLRLFFVIFSIYCQSDYFHIWKSSPHHPIPRLHLLTAIIWFISSSHGAVHTGTSCIKILSAPSSVPPRPSRFSARRSYTPDTW